MTSAPVWASDAQMGNISHLYATSNGAVMFYTDGARGTPPACQNAAVSQRYAIDASTTGGQAQAAALMTAYSLHKRIYIVGSGACTIWGDTETIAWFLVED
ncbi:hypothetical protein [Caulobacter sp. Root655]|uniref:hypothetical protein n=1 Tax=Caulobacter sp. Root655 TaxID=1736578 RepID=UPI0012E3E8D5|nr:hypothetical protein [Caulobacter sp. Root655]